MSEFRKRMKRIFLNETGQMTVFVALIFQVLFVFFAMVINIGLLVHDKINLQNAVDLGAYYGAQRQAEILNEIAHINYQIHQDNKLLAWRFHVLGTLGRDGASGTTAATNLAADYPPDAVEGPGLPSVCVANSYWLEATANGAANENHCWRDYGPGGAITKIPELRILAPFVPGVLLAQAQISALRNNQDISLNDNGPLNWAFAAEMLEAYKMSLTSRKAVIQKLRKNLVDGNFVDQGTQSVALGVLETIKKNLTESNFRSFQDDQFAVKNGLSFPSCAGEQGDGAKTISEIRTAPLLLYTSADRGPNTFELTQQPQSVPPPDARRIPYDPAGFLLYFSNGEPSDSIGNDSPSGLNASSLGFEKNPWCMAYVGVHAKTAPRKPFAPFGESVSLEARAFAQPFGGRIGPWYKSQWPAAALASTGRRTDPLSPPRFINNANEGGEETVARLPNYSRYPGDLYGLKSLAAQAATRRLLAGYNVKGTKQLSYKFYLGFDQIAVTGDPLAWDENSPANPSDLVRNVRLAESLAVSPDVFDVTYYSIDPFYATNYKALNGDGTRLGNLGTMFGNQISVPPDIGGRNGTDLEGFSINAQVENANSPDIRGLDPTLRQAGKLDYFIYSIAHILTGWAPNSASSFAFPDTRFAQCAHMVKEAKYMLPGGCTNGGRTGYSVRLLSRDHLLSAKWNVGGEGQLGPINNPPGLDF